ncbi:MAG TPA: ABC transporter permease [Blastocatellia bacterium]|nr:ABC transporter permease [Blastocatellia bacterium]
MITDILTMIWKEWKELLLQQGGVRTGLLPMVIIPLGLLGIMLPWQMGAAWVTSPLALGIWAWLPLMLTTSLIADSFAGERERHTLETLLASRLPDRAILFGKMGAVMSYGWGLTMGSVLLGLVTVNLVHRQEELLLYSWPFLLGIVGVSVLGSWLAASAGALISLRAATVRQAQQILMLSIMGLLFVPVYGLQLLPDEWRAQLTQALLTIGSPAQLIAAFFILLAALDLGLTMAAMARFQRARLVFD